MEGNLVTFPVSVGRRHTASPPSAYRRTAPLLPGSGRSPGPDPSCGKAETGRAVPLALLPYIPEPMSAHKNRQSSDKYTRSRTFRFRCIVRIRNQIFHILTRPVPTFLWVGYLTSLHITVIVKEICMSFDVLKTGLHLTLLIKAESTCLAVPREFLFLSVNSIIIKPRGIDRARKDK